MSLKIVPHLYQVKELRGVYMVKVVGTSPDVQQQRSCFETWQHIKCKWDVFTIMIINIVIYAIMIVYVIMILQYITDKVLIIVFKVIIIIKVLMIVNQEIGVIVWNNLKPV